MLEHARDPARIREAATDDACDFFGDTPRFWGGRLARVQMVEFGIIAEQRGDIRQAMQQLASIGKQASATLEQTTALMRNANGLLNDQGKQALGSAEQAMKSLEQSTTTISTLLSKNENSLDNGMQGLNGLAPAIRELRETLTSLRAISQRLEANPSGYLLGRDKNKEFTP